MIYRNLGKSDIKVSGVIFGAWAIGGWMWGGTDRQEAVKAIRKAVESGVTTIDTAAVYGFGLSEEIVAEAIEPFKRENLQILTKCGMRWDLKQDAPIRWVTQDRFGNPVNLKHYAKHDSVIYECEQSLKRLNTDCVDLYQLHRPDESTPIEETMEAMAKLLEQGKIRAVGLSNCDMELTRRAGTVITITANQPPFSMILRGAEDELIPYCAENDISVIVYSPLQRGLLTGKITEDYKFNEDDHRKGHPLFTGDNLKKKNRLCDELKPIANAHNVSLAQLVINWTVNHKGITAALVGARNEKQACENAASLGFTLSDEEVSMIDSKVYALEVDSPY